MSTGSPSDHNCNQFLDLATQLEIIYILRAAGQTGFDWFSLVDMSASPNPKVSRLGRHEAAGKARVTQRLTRDRLAAKKLLPAPQVNNFGKRSYGHVSAQAFPSVTVVNRPILQKILRDQGVPFDPSDDIAALSRRYKSIVEQSACPKPKRHRLPSVRDESSSRSAHDSSASDDDDTSSGRSDTPLGQSAPSSHNLSVGPSNHCTNVSHLSEPAANQGPPSLTNHESSDSEPSIEIVDQQQPVTGSHRPSQVSMDLSDNCDDPLESNTVPRQNGKRRLIASSDSSDDSDVDHQMESAIVPPCSGQLVKSQMQPTQSSRGLSKSLNDLNRYPTRQRKLPDYNGRLQADEVVDSDERSCTETESSSEEEEEWVPHRGNQEEEEEWVPHRGNQEINEANDMTVDPDDVADQGEEQFGEVIDNHPDLDSLPTGRLRDLVKGQGFPCSALDCDQLLVICEAFGEMHTGNRTRSGRPFREQNPLDQSSSPVGPHHDDEPSIMNPETNNESPQDSGNLSCKALHQQMASQIAALQTNHQLTIEQIDKVLKAVDELREKVAAPEPTSQDSRATQRSESPPAQRSDLRRLLRQHCAILLGWSTERKQFPQPATEGERSEWGEPIDQSSNAGQRELYVHEAATEQQVKIIKNIMLQAGVRRFAPNFLQPPNAPNNKFLWQLAEQSFVELLRCGEYEVDSQLQDPLIISQEIRKYVRETLSRRYKQENLWPQSKQCSHSTTLKRNSRRLHLVDQRLAVASQFEGLEDLVPAIKAACSDDETDYEEAPQRNLKRGRKHCNIFQVPWRSPEFSEFLILLDQIAQSQRSSGFYKPSGPPPPCLPPG